MAETSRTPQTIAATLVEGSHGNERLTGYRAQEAARAASAGNHFFSLERHLGADAREARREQYLKYFQAATRAHETGLSRASALGKDISLAGLRWGTTLRSFVPGVAIGAALQAPVAREIAGGAVAAAQGIRALTHQADIQRDIAAGIQEGRNFSTRSEVVEAAETQAAAKAKGPDWWKQARGKLAGVGARFSEAHRQATVAARLSGEVSGVTDSLHNYRSETESTEGTTLGYIADTNALVDILAPACYEYIQFDEETGKYQAVGLSLNDLSIKQRLALIDFEARMQLFDQTGDFTFQLLDAEGDQLSLEETSHRMRELRDIFAPLITIKNSKIDYHDEPGVKVPDEIQEERAAKAPRTYSSDERRSQEVFQFQVEGRLISLESARRKIRKGMRNDRLVHGLGASAVSLVGVNAGIAVGSKLHDVWEAHGEGIRDFAGSVAAHAHEMVDEAGQVVGNVWERARQASMSAQEFALAMHAGGRQQVAAMLRGGIAPDGGKVHRTLGRVAQHARSLKNQLTGHAANRSLEALPQHAHTGVPLGPDTMQHMQWDTLHDKGLIIGDGGISYTGLDSVHDRFLQPIAHAMGRKLTNNDLVYIADVNGKFEAFPYGPTPSIPPGTPFSVGFLVGGDNKLLSLNQIAQGGLPPNAHILSVASAVTPGKASAVTNVVHVMHPFHDGRIPSGHDFSSSQVPLPPHAPQPSDIPMGDGLTLQQNIEVGATMATGALLAGGLVGGAVAWDNRAERIHNQQAYEHAIRTDPNVLYTNIEDTLRLRQEKIARILDTAANYKPDLDPEEVTSTEDLEANMHFEDALDGTPFAHMPLDTPSQRDAFEKALAQEQRRMTIQQTLVDVFASPDVPIHEWVRGLSLMRGDAQEAFVDLLPETAREVFHFDQPQFLEWMEPHDFETNFPHLTTRLKRLFAEGDTQAVRKIFYFANPAIQQAFMGHLRREHLLNEMDSGTWKATGNIALSPEM